MKHDVLAQIIKDNLNPGNTSICATAFVEDLCDHIEKGNNRFNREDFKKLLPQIDFPLG